MSAKDCIGCFARPAARRDWLYCDQCREAMGKGGMTVDGADAIVQNAERPAAGNGRAPESVTRSALSGAREMGRSCCPHFAHPSGRSNRGVPMSQNDNTFRGRSPSGWHDSAMARDAGHDEMQIAVCEHLRALPSRPMTVHDKLFVVDQVHIEVPIMRGQMIVAWCDVLRTWKEDAQKYRPARLFDMFEIKPAIHSVGAVIRQCQSLEIVAESTFLAGEAPGSVAMAFPIVRAADPKLSLLRRGWGGLVMAWDGETLS